MCHVPQNTQRWDWSTQFVLKYKSAVPWYYCCDSVENEDAICQIGL